MDINAITRTLSEFASDLEFDRLPEPVVRQAKRSVLDTIGCAVYGAALPWTRTVTDMLVRQGSGGTSSVWGTGRKLAAADAALSNGTAAHGFELDDVHQESYLHVGSVTLPATLALAQVNSPVTGRDLITAQVAGYETGVRVGLACARGLLKRGFHPTAVIGAVAASAAGARVLGLDAVGTHDSVGASGSFAAGLVGAQYGSNVKRMHAGRAAQSGTYCALLATVGFRGIRDLFDLPDGGFLDAFAAEYDSAAILKGLGDVWYTPEIGYKLYPACGASHTSIEAALDIAGRNSLDWTDIDNVRIAASTHLVNHVGWRYVPDTITTAQMNLSFAVASALYDGVCSVDQFADERLANPDILALAERVQAAPDPRIDSLGVSFRNQIDMRIVTKDGREFEQSVERVRGTGNRPVDDEELYQKFSGLVIGTLGEERTQAVLSRLKEFETCPDVSELIELFSAH